jgi:uncharacterized protein YndB with AHSA1/START domain
MSAPQTSPQGAAVGDFVISRVLNAPRELVWKSWTEVERLKQWWGPKGFKVVHAALDLRPNGAFHYGMTSPDGHDMWGKFTFREISAPSRLVFLSSFSDPDGNITRAPFPGLQWPLKMLTTVTLAECDGKTELTIRAAAFEATPEEQKTFDGFHDSMRGGWGGTLDILSDYLVKA